MLVKMIRINIKRVFFLLLVILMCSIIFLFSSQNGSESKSISRGFVYNILNIFPEFSEKTSLEKVQIVENFQFLVRKAAHFSVYTMLGLAAMCLLSTYQINMKKKIIISFLIGFIYAIIDEIHQLFSPGRTAMIFDVFVDSVGVIFGISIVCLIMYLLDKRNGNKVLVKE